MELTRVLTSDGPIAERYAHTVTERVNPPVEE